MTNLFAIKKSELKAKTIITTIAVITAVALPQLFLAIGIISGTGPAVGAAFLPMHLPVLLAGFMAGPVVGIIAGVNYDGKYVEIYCSCEERVFLLQYADLGGCAGGDSNLAGSSNCHRISLSIRILPVCFGETGYLPLSLRA